MNNNYENLPAVLNANQLATALGISRAGAYQLLNTATFPTLRIGKRLLVPRDRLPGAEGQREIRGYAGNGQPGVCQGSRSGNAGVFHAGLWLSEGACRRGKYYFCRGTHG